MNKGLLIFDFDDTLVSTNPVFDAAKMRFVSLIRRLALDVPNLLEIVNEYDKQLVREKGFARDCFPRALVRAYRYCCQFHGKQADEQVVREIENIGWWVFDQPLEVKEGVPEVLAALRENYVMLLVTKGDRKHQMTKVQESGLDRYFDDVFVVNEKDATLFSSLCWNFAGSLRDCWSIGNSIKSDINPALCAGINAILMRAPTWDFETEPLLAPVPEVEKMYEVRFILEEQSEETG